MEEQQIKTAATLMVEAYGLTKTQGAAIAYVEKEIPGIAKEILWVMWIAIDAYVDIKN